LVLLTDGKNACRVVTLPVTLPVRGRAFTNVRRTTLADIAKEAGFSINTVSRALNGKSDVREETRQIILEAARRLEYYPDRLARGLRQQATHVLGLVVSDVANPFFGALVKSISAVARSRDYHLLLQDTDESPIREKEAVEVLLAERIDGVLICPVQEDTTAIEKLVRSGIPVVLIGRRFQDLPVDYVVPDDTQGGRLAAEHLLQLGHRRIGMINAPERISSARERYEGFVEAHQAYGLSIEPELVRSDVVDHIAGYRETAALLEQMPEVTAIVAYSDFVAFGVARAIWERGLRIPEDISLIGFDDTPLATCLPVPLSTVRSPIQELGVEAIEVLCSKIAGDLSGDVRKTISMKLISRGSTAAPGGEA